MKTYFKYEGLIKSKEAAEAIAAPVALGPFCGFGSVKVKLATYGSGWIMGLTAFI